MRRLASVLAFAVVLGITWGAIGQTAVTQAPQDDPRVADLIRAGELRVGIGLGVLMQAIKNPATGELRGAALELARALRRGLESGSSPSNIRDLAPF